MRRTALVLVALAGVACGDAEPTGPTSTSMEASGTWTADEGTGNAAPSEASTGSEALEGSFAPDIDPAL